jgi:hypothetical protein
MATKTLFSRQQPFLFVRHDPFGKRNPFKKRIYLFIPNAIHSDSNFDSAIYQESNHLNEANLAVCYKVGIDTLEAQHNHKSVLD